MSEPRYFPAADAGSNLGRCAPHTALSIASLRRRPFHKLVKWSNYLYARGGARAGPTHRRYEDVIGIQPLDDLRTTTRSARTAAVLARPPIAAERRIGDATCARAARLQYLAASPPTSRKSGNTGSALLSAILDVAGYARRKIEFTVPHGTIQNWHADCSRVWWGAIRRSKATLGREKVVPVLSRRAARRFAGAALRRFRHVSRRSFLDSVGGCAACVQCRRGRARETGKGDAYRLRTIRTIARDQ